MLTYKEVHSKENHSKKAQVICPNCKESHITGTTPIFLMCRDCLWMGEIYEMLFTLKEDDKK